MKIISDMPPRSIILLSLQSTENIKWSFRLHPTPQQVLPASLCRNISDFLQFTRNPAWQKQKEMRKFWLVSLLVLERETSRRWQPTGHMLCCEARWPFPGRRHEEENAAGRRGGCVMLWSCWILALLWTRSQGIQLQVETRNAYRPSPHDDVLNNGAKWDVSARSSSSGWLSATTKPRFSSKSVKLDELQLHLWQPSLIWPTLKNVQISKLYQHEKHLKIPQKKTLNMIIRWWYLWNYHVDAWLSNKDNFFLLIQVLVF